jgi:hypothetical protein
MGLDVWFGEDDAKSATVADSIFPTSVYDIRSGELLQQQCSQVRGRLPVRIVEGFRVLQSIAARRHRAYQGLKRRQGLRSRWEWWRDAFFLHRRQQKACDAWCQAQHLFDAIGQHQEPIEGGTGRLVRLVDALDYDRQPMACNLDLCVHVHRASIVA